jgi:hypothetical protein
MRMVGAWHLRILASIAGGICVGVGVGIVIGKWCVGLRHVVHVVLVIGMWLLLTP